MSMFEPASVSTGVASSTPDVTIIVQLNIRKSLSGLEETRAVVVSIIDSLIFAEGCEWGLRSYSCSRAMPLR